MSKLSQQELLTEGFLDIVRQAAVKAGGAIVGAAKNVGKDFLTMNPNANLFASAASGAKEGFAKANTLYGRLKKALKDEYYNTFNYNTVKFGKTKRLQGDSSGNSRMAVEFTAKRIRGVNVPSAPGTLQGGEGSADPSKAGQAEQYTAIFTRTKKGSGGEYLLEIRDSSNRVIRGTKDKKQREKISWGEEFATADWPNPSNITVADLAAWIEDAVGYGVLTRPRRAALANAFGITGSNGTQTVEQILTNPNATPIILGSQGPPLTSTTPLTQQQIETIKRQFIQLRIFTESHKKTQLQLLESSYNLIYELPINKGN